MSPIRPTVRPRTSAHNRGTASTNPTSTRPGGTPIRVSRRSVGGGSTRYSGCLLDSGVYRGRSGEAGPFPCLWSSKRTRFEDVVGSPLRADAAALRSRTRDRLAWPCRRGQSAPGRRGGPSLPYPRSAYAPRAGRSSSGSCHFLRLRGGESRKKWQPSTFGGRPSAGCHSWRLAAQLRSPRVATRGGVDPRLRVAASRGFEPLDRSAWQTPKHMTAHRHRRYADL